jgi:hypothetical protein
MDNQTPPFSKPQPQKTNIVLIVVVGFIVFIGAILTGIFINQARWINTPTYNLSNGSKIYENKLHHYSLEYPSDWEIGGAQNVILANYDSPVLNSPCTENQQARCAQLDIKTGKSDSAKNFDPFFVINLDGSNPDKITNKASTTINNEAAIGFELLQTNITGSSLLSYVLVTYHNNIKYTFRYEEYQQGITILTAKDWQYKAIFDQIISSFRFTN